MEIGERSQQTLSAILSALAAVGQSTAAKVMDVSEASMSRWKSDEIPVMAKFLTALELNLYPASFVVVDPKYLDALRTLARKGLE